MVGVDPMEDGCAAAVLARNAQEAVATHAIIAAIRAGVIIRRVRVKVNIFSACIGRRATRQIFPHHPALAVVYVAPRHRAAIGINNTL